jgi:anti-sigma factor RsiW
MKCQEIHGLVDAYVDRELDVVAALEFERHLNECATCRAGCEQYQQLHDSVRAQMPYFEAPEGLEDKIRASLRSVGRNQGQRLQRQWFPPWRVWALAAGMIVVLVFSVVLFRIVGRPPASELLADQVVSNHIRSLMANHLTDVPSSDQHTVKPWFSGKLDFAPVVKDLSSKGFVLVGGRLDYLDNQTVAALVYKRRQHTINLFVWPSPASDSGPATIASKGYNVVHGTQSHMAYWAVSDLNAGELNEFAHDLEK